MTTQHLAITAHVQNSPELVSELSKVSSQLTCNIEAVRVTALGDHFVITLAISGPWDAVAKLETALASINERKDVFLIFHRFNLREEYPASLPYTANITTLDEPGITRVISEFFLGLGIDIEELYGESYLTPTGTQMYSMNIGLLIPTDIHVATLRDNFISFCDNLNIDAVLEPMRF
jgi:glycine cleavage system transcriptional repressor